MKEQLQKRRVIPFVGAGVSMAVTRPDGERLFPSWGDLLQQGAQRLDDEDKAADADLVRTLLGVAQPKYFEAAQHLRDSLPPSVWASFLKGAVGFHSRDADPKSLDLARAVWTLGSRLVITTNYDRVLEWASPDAADLERWDIEATAEQADMIRRGGVERPTVWYLHGRIGNAARLVLTPDGYQRLYGSTEAGSRAETESLHRAALETLRHVLASHTLLFVGFSLADEHFGMELRGMAEVFEGYAGLHYVLVHEGQAARLREQAPPGVEVLTFRDYGEPLVEMVEALAQHVPPEDDIDDEDDVKEEWDVYLAAVADSLKPVRERVCDALRRRDLKVADEIPPPTDAESHRRRVSEVLQRSRLSVHLLDDSPGAVIFDQEDETYPRVQARLGLEEARSQLIWIPRRLDLPQIEDEVQRDFLVDLEGRRLGDSYELHRGARADLPADILDKLAAPVPPANPEAPPPQLVLLDVNADDMDLTMPMKAFLAQNQIQTVTSRWRNDPRNNLQYLTDQLHDAGALVVVHGSVDPDWVCARLDEAVKIAVNDWCPVEVFCVYLAPPKKRELRPYAKYRKLNFHLLDHQDDFKPEGMAPIFENLVPGSGGPA